MKRCLAIAIIIVFNASLPGRAWGVLGHRAVAKVAENHLTPRARQRIAQLLGPESLPLISTWADDFRESSNSLNSAPWHFVNAPAGLSREDYVALLQSDRAANRHTLYTELPRLISELQNPATASAQKVQDLKFIVHLVGDAHQPLHAGRQADLGGNQIPIYYRKQYTNLHSLWDVDLVEYPGLTYTEMALAYDLASSEQQTQWAKDPLETWLFESYQLCTPLYDEAKTPNFPFTYYSDHVDTVQKRIFQAGIRLAAVLNSVFAS